MSTTTVRPTAAHRAAATAPPARPSLSRASGDPTAVRTFLTRFAGTLLPLLAAVVGLEFAWQLLLGSSWPAAGALATGWALAGGWWLSRRGWPVGHVLAVTGAPAAVLAGPAALGWLSPAGLVLWGPVSTVLATALAMASQPLAPQAAGRARCRARPAGVSGGGRAPRRGPCRGRSGPGSPAR